MTTKTKPKTSHRSDVHRALHLTTPALEGPDVELFQKQINHQFAHFKFTWREITADGEYGKRTRDAAEFLAWLLGISAAQRRIMGGEAGRINEALQRKLRSPKNHLGKADRVRQAARKRKRAKLLKAHTEGIAAQLAWLEKNLHVNEEPPESNRGPFPIDECQAFFGLSSQPWCGCLAGYAAKKIGGAVTDTWFPYAGSIRVDAEAGRNNLQKVAPENARPGDIVTFFSGGDDHVGTIRKASAGGMVFTYEGNTSSATRDSDGGIIEEKERSFGEVSCVARITNWG